MFKNLKYKIIILPVIISLVALTGNSISRAEDNNNPPAQPVGIVENLGDFIPDDVLLIDEYGRQVNVKDLVNKPTVFSFVYFRCPGICTPLLNGLQSVVDKVDLQPGKDFDVITISIDQTEDYLMASDKKNNYLEGMTRDMPVDSWRFLTGDSINIQKISGKLGFNFQRQGVDFMHGAAIMMVSPEGKIVRYLYGTDFLPFDFKMAVIEASEGKVGTTIGKIMKFCFSYDPEGRNYVLNVTRIAGGSIIILLAIFFGILILKRKKKPLKADIEV
jgi:protein SCO1/2